LAYIYQEAITLGQKQTSGIAITTQKKRDDHNNEKNNPIRDWTLHGQVDKDETAKRTTNTMGI